MRVLEMYDNLGSGNYGGINRMHVYGWLNDISAWIATIEIPPTLEMLFI